MLLPVEESAARHPGPGRLANAHVEAWQARQIRSGLIATLVRKTRAQGVQWLRGYVAGWPMWEGLREEFWREWRQSQCETEHTNA